VLVELVQNAVEHGLGAAGGRVRVRVRQEPGRLVVAVSDDGAGLPEGFDVDRAAGLGLQIVRTLVEAELGGRLTVGPGAAGGACAEVSVPRPATSG
jgi:two-component sensor histidine kinase